jgi:hypothetical protein
MRKMDQYKQAEDAYAAVELRLTANQRAELKAYRDNGHMELYHAKLLQYIVALIP